MWASQKILLIPTHLSRSGTTKDILSMGTTCAQVPVAKKQRKRRIFAQSNMAAPVTLLHVQLPQSSTKSVPIGVSSFKSRCLPVVSMGRKVSWTVSIHFQVKLNVTKQKQSQRIQVEWLFFIHVLIVKMYRENNGNGSTAHALKHSNAIFGNRWVSCYAEMSKVYETNMIKLVTENELIKFVFYWEWWIWIKSPGIV